MILANGGILAEKAGKCRNTEGKVYCGTGFMEKSARR